jgi:hypothetical protein
MQSHTAAPSRAPVALLAALVVLVPVLLVHLIPTDSVEPFQFRAHLVEELGRSSNGQLQYYRVEAIEGVAPAPIAAIALDRSYSRGVEPVEVGLGFDAWFQGSLMTPDVYYGEQYLFFGLPQIYVRQVKSGLLWPDQWSGMRVLYLSPLETLAAPLQIPFLVRSDSFTPKILAVLVARCVLIAATAFVAVRRRLRGARLAATLLAYALASILVSVPILGDLY